MRRVMINWPDRLVEDLAKKRCVIFLGSGVSANSKNDKGQHPPIWANFLTEGADSLNAKCDRKLIKGEINRHDYLLACELLRKKLGRDGYNELLRRRFQNGYHHADIHRDIFMLDALIYITPNFDKIFDTYVTTQTEGNTVIKQYYDDDILDYIRSERNLILKIHGSIDTPDRLIFTKGDYARARTKNADFYKIFEALVLTRTFLFLGAGLNDPDVQLVLENTAFTYRNSSKHFFVIPNTSRDILDIYRENMNLDFITYDSKDNHQQLLDGIKDLYAKVQDAMNVNV